MRRDEAAHSIRLVQRRRPKPQTGEPVLPAVYESDRRGIDPLDRLTHRSQFHQHRERLSASMTAQVSSPARVILGWKPLRIVTVC
ncbi:hypothetical protein [Thermomicrobium sp.]